MLPNQVMIVGSPRSGKLSIIKDTFGTLPSPVLPETHSGLTHNVAITTKYYSTSVGLMVDEPQDRTATHTALPCLFEAWCETLGGEECAELREVLDGLVFTFNVSDPIESVQRYGTALAALLDAFANDAGEASWEGIRAAVGFRRAGEPALASEIMAEVEDIFLEGGIEFILYEEEGRSKDEEGNLVGKARMKELFEAHEWRDMTLEWTAEPETATSEPVDSSALNGLLTNSELDLSEIMAKLQRAKLDTEALNTMEEKHTYAEAVVSQLMEYLG